MSWRFFARFLFSPRGRIGRLGWWLGQVFLGLVALAIHFGLEALGLGASPSPGPLHRLLSFAVFWPAVAMTLKRLNDRDHPAWLGRVWAVTSGLTLAFIQVFGPDIRQLQSGPLAALGVMMLFGLWVFIDNGFLKGTVGPNRYGPDPLAPTPARSPTVQPASATLARRYFPGAFIRDAVLAVVFLVVVMIGAGPSLGLPDLGKWGFRRLTMPDDLRLYAERSANVPASDAMTAGRKADVAGDRRAAIEHFTRAIALYGPDEPTAAEAYRGRGWVLRKTGKLAEALADYDRAIALEPGYASAQYYRGLIYVDLGRHAEGLADFDAVVRKRPDDADAHLGRGQALEKLDRPDQAIDAYAAAMAAAPRGLERNVKLRSGDAAEAASWREKLGVERDRTIARAHVRRGNVLRKLGRPDEALADYEEALRLQPNFQSAYVDRGWLHEQAGRRELARADYQKAAALQPPDEWLQRALDRTQ